MARAAGATYCRVELIGRVAQEPRVRMVSGDRLVADLTVHHRTRQTDPRTGRWRTISHPHLVTVWGRRAEYVRDRVRMGDMVHVSGEYRPERWVSGDGRERWTMRIHPDRLRHLTSPLRTRATEVVDAGFEEGVGDSGGGG